MAIKVTCEVIWYVEFKSGIISQSESPIYGKMDVLVLYTYVIALQGFPTSCKYCIEPELKVYETAIKVRNRMSLNPMG